MSSRQQSGSFSLDSERVSEGSSEQQQKSMENLGAGTLSKSPGKEVQAAEQ